MKKDIKTNWELEKGGETHYVYVTAKEVVVGSHWGTGQSDSAGYTSHRDFLAGQKQDIIRFEYGASILAEVIEAVRDFSESGSSQ